VALHYSVMLQETLEWLNPKEGQHFLDGTLGAAGHSLEISRRIGPSGRLLGLDVDESALDVARDKLEEINNVSFYQLNFENMAEALKKEAFSSLDGILLDIGVSSMQLDQAQRGFSFRDENEGDLDMRMNQSVGMPVKDYLKSVPKSELEKVIKEYGEERYYKRIANAIIEQRKIKKIETTKELAELIRKAIPGPRTKIDKATRTFQALRILINRELDVLKNAIEEAIKLLEVGGRLVIISFHSLEDRIVKWSFRDLKDNGQAKILTKKPLLPSEKEMRENGRSRSAKMRVLEKI